MATNQTDTIQNTSANNINTSATDLLREVKSENEEYEEDDIEVPIIKREIRSKITTPFDELKLTPEKDLNFKIIRFDLDFYSADNKFSWVVYHTPREIRKHIKNISQNL